MMRFLVMGVALGAVGCGADPTWTVTMSDAAVDGADATNDGRVAQPWRHDCVGSGSFELVEATPSGIVEDRLWDQSTLEIFPFQGGIVLHTASERFGGNFEVVQGPAGTFAFRPASAAMRLGKRGGVNNAQFTVQQAGPLTLAGRRLRGVTTWAFTATGARPATNGTPVSGVYRWTVNMECLTTGAP